MITRGILDLIIKKLHSVIMSLAIIGILFFILATAILFYPQFLQILFIIAFFGISFAAFLIAIKINHIKDNFEKLLKLTKK